MSETTEEQEDLLESFGRFKEREENGLKVRQDMTVREASCFFRQKDYTQGRFNAKFTLKYSTLEDPKVDGLLALFLNQDHFATLGKLEESMHIGTFEMRVKCISTIMADIRNCFFKLIERNYNARWYVEQGQHIDEKSTRYEKFVMVTACNALMNSIKTDV
jgi:hypothetical protein